MADQVALVSQTNKIKLDELALVSAAIQKQITRDVGPAWNINGTVDSFGALKDIPLGYWSVVIRDDIPYAAAGIHLNKANGQPYSLVKYSEDWPLTTSHEVIEMLVDPSGNYTKAANSPQADQGRVLVLVEVCDPSEASQHGYTVNGILLSDFYTPRFFDPVKSSGVQYSFSGAITEPLQVLEGGYISWWDPVTKHVFQLFVQNGQNKIEDRGPVPAGFGSLRSFADSFTNERRAKATAEKPQGLMLTGALGITKQKKTKLDASTKASADLLTQEIEDLLKTYG